ncbi:hypothetical protein O9H85_16550 [Paenibacillus filicis]|uniref:Uncharacterized protein n=1 Tax=Paenibacillus gyeongsangnamensis TaxID=3388067 RepID=A0ABT4QB04_9BACL|nr:hypothetical protein [Paenibacillus filicis]MCZ8514003.1 hypothetical protein [Paenibacillus filicis]
MNRKEFEEQLIKNYQQDEHMMILVFAQWCINCDLDPEAVYREAYPQQEANAALQQALALTVSKEEAGDIPDETLLGVLSLFGNDELAYIVTEHIQKRKRNKRAT